MPFVSEQSEQARRARASTSRSFPCSLASSRALALFALLTTAVAACGDSGGSSGPQVDGGSSGGSDGSSDGAATRDGPGADDGALPPPRDGGGTFSDAKADGTVGKDGGGDNRDVRSGSDASDVGAGADAGTPRDGGSTADGRSSDVGIDGGARPDASSQDAGPRGDSGTPSDAGGADAGRPGWTLVFSDEFDLPSGTGVDTTKWNLVNKGDGFGNNELQYYTNRTTNAYHDGNGFLVIKAIKESYMGREYTSARLESNGKVEHTYGRFEARMQLPRGQGIWPAFWMLGNDIGTASWPNCGEIDIMENIGKEPSTVHGNLHGPGYSGANPIGQSYTLPGGQKFADGFHVFAVEWEQNVVRFYVDDIHYGTKTPADMPAGGRWVYDHPFYLLLNVAVGGNWPGAPDGTTVFPQTLTVDYVRVYSR